MKKRSGTSAIVKDIIIVVIGIVIIWVGLRVAFGTENPFYVVSSGSMIPNLNIFDVIVVQGNDPFDHLKVGDIIVFNRPSVHDKVIVHRVAEILNANPLVIRTKGDANPGSIPGTDYPITKDDYIGKVVYVIPQIGYVTRILTPPTNYIIIAVIVGIMLVKQFGKSKSEPDIPKDDLDERQDKIKDVNQFDNKLDNNLYGHEDVTKDPNESESRSSQEKSGDTNDDEPDKKQG